MSVPLDVVYANNESCFSSRRQITVLFLWACLCSACTQRDAHEKTTAKVRDENTGETRVGGRVGLQSAINTCGKAQRARRASNNRLPGKSHAPNHSAKGIPLAK